MKKEIAENLLEEKIDMRIPMKLQFFAEGSDGSGDGGDGEGDGEEGEGDANQSKNTGENKDGKKDKTFNQKQVSSMMAEEKRQGRNSVYNELGLDEKSAKEEIEAYKKWKNSQKTEEQLAAERNAQSEKEKAELKERTVKAEMKAEALKLGFKSEFIDDVVTLASVKLVDGADMTKVLEELKTRYPNFLESSNDDDDSNVGKKGTGSPVKQTGKKSGNGGKDSLGSRLAATRVADANKSSFF